MKDTWQTLLRTVAKVAAGAMGTHGLINSSEVETITSAIVIIGSVLWGIWEKKLIARKAVETLKVTTNVETKTETK
jgi:acetyl-CoA acetyltransferase